MTVGLRDNSCIDVQGSAVYSIKGSEYQRMPEGEITGMEGLGAFGDASTIAPDFQVASAHCVTGH